MLAPQPMQEADYPAIRSLSKSLGRQAAPQLWGTAECQLVIKSGSGELLGWARAHWWDPDDPVAPAGYYLGGIEIAGDHRQRGLARSLSEARLAWIAQRASKAWCVVNVHNAASLALARSLGFKEEARAARFGTVVFTGGSGVLLSKELASTRGNAREQD